MQPLSRGSGRQASGLFVFGTLVDAPIRKQVMGTPAWPATPARLHGYIAFRVEGEEYPALKPYLGAVTPGLLLPLPPAARLARLDEHEGQEYRRGIVLVSTDGRLRRAACYLTASGVALSRDGWRVDARWLRRREGYRRRQFSPASSRMIA